MGNDGGIYVTGSYYSDNMVFYKNYKATNPGRDISLTSTGGASNTDMVISKYDASEKIIWTLAGGGAAINDGHDLGLDSERNVYVSGYNTINSTFGAYSLTKDTFVVKVNPPVKPLAPASFTVKTSGAHQIDLKWRNVANETII